MKSPLYYNYFVLQVFSGRHGTWENSVKKLSKTCVSGITSQKIRQMTLKYRQFASLIVLLCGSKKIVYRRRNVVNLLLHGRVPISWKIRQIRLIEVSTTFSIFFKSSRTAQKRMSISLSWNLTKVFTLTKLIYSFMKS